MNLCPKRLRRSVQMWLFWITTCGLWIMASCTNEAEAFCRETTAQLCTTCYACGADDKQGSNRCGLSVQTTEEGCKTILRRVCSSEGIVTFSEDNASKCQQQVRALTCDDPKPMQSIKRACGTFF